jgi:dGTP triphosphohydrolase
MKKLTSIQTNAVNAYSEYLTSGMTYGDAMRKAAKELGDTPCITLLEELAKVHATKYGCNYTWNTAGTAVFYTGKESTRESRHGAAFQSWRRNVMVWFTPERDAKPVKAMRLSNEARQAAKAYLAQFNNVADAIKALKAVAK